MVLLAFEDEPSAQLFNKTVNHRQPQARAFADALGGEKRVHRRDQRGFIHALAGIGNAQADVASRGQG
ncbi:hypothetical protein D9M68_975970 [compost metagenome]